MKDAEPESTREATEILVKTLHSTYAKSDPEKVSANVVQLNTDKTIKFLGLLNKFEYLFDDTLGEWDTYPVDLELKPDSKPVNIKYCPIPRINKEVFCKELKISVGIVMLTPVHQSQYGMHVFKIPNK